MTRWLIHAHSPTLAKSTAELLKCLTEVKLVWGRCQSFLWPSSAFIILTLFTLFFTCVYFIICCLILINLIWFDLSSLLSIQRAQRIFASSLKNKYKADTCFALKKNISRQRFLARVCGGATATLSWKLVVETTVTTTIWLQFNCATTIRRLTPRPGCCTLT